MKTSTEIAVRLTSAPTVTLIRGWSRTASETLDRARGDRRAPQAPARASSPPTDAVSSASRQGWERTVATSMLVTAPREEPCSTVRSPP